MKRFEDRVPLVLQTNRGLTPIDKLNLGDYVYNFINGDEMEVYDIITHPKETIYKVTYTDGRFGFYRGSELMYGGNSLISVENIMRIMDVAKYDDSSLHELNFGNIRHNFIDYNKHRLVTPLYPDPYITGCLVMYGDYRDKYINLPRRRREANNLFSHKYQLNYGEVLRDNIMYYSWDGAPGDQLITWKEFFLNTPGRWRSQRYPIIPLSYLRASHNDRWQFIQGVFDLGFDPEETPDTLSIRHENEYRLKGFQKILWSMGYLSTISFSPNSRMMDNRGRPYRLDIHTPRENHPRFFYWYDFITHHIQNERRIIDRCPEFKLQIKYIEKHATAVSKNVRFYHSHQVYLDHNFLPRVSEG